MLVCFHPFSSVFGHYQGKLPEHRKLPEHLMYLNRKQFKIELKEYLQLNVQLNKIPKQSDYV